MIYKSQKRKKILFGFFFFLNIAILFVFKYIPFCIGTLRTVSSWFRFPLTFSVPQVFVPLGLSFIIFQSSTYLGDIYRRNLTPVSIVDYALFVAWFPTVLSGPIQKARDLLPQIKAERAFEFERFQSGFLLILYGFFEKFFVADALAKAADTVFSSYEEYYGMYYLIAAACYSFQIYADFSSYSDIAKGLSRLFGIEITGNFRNPYLSGTLAGFWRNWHTSLNAWLVEYVYIPLGGNRKGKLRKYGNILFVFLCSGLWHGASWHYVVWGVLNGILQIAGELTFNFRKKLRDLAGLGQSSRLVKWVQTGIVFLIISTTWIFFRTPSVAGAAGIVKSIYSMGITGIFNRDAWEIFGSVYQFAMTAAALLLFIKLQCMRRQPGRLYQLYFKEPKAVREIVLVFVMAVLIVCFCATLSQSNTEYIYFQF